jgi:hypothetical protein
MSLYEIMSTLQAVVRRRKSQPVAATPEQMASARKALADLTANDPSVRLH